MEETNPPRWSEDEERMLRHEAFVAEVNRRRARTEGDGRTKPRWQRFLESTGGAAMITVLLGGMLGQLITWSVQKGLKEREFQEAWMKARGDQALVTYKEYLNQEQETVRRVYEIVGNLISASKDLIDLTQQEFAPGRYVGIEKQRNAIRERYNAIDGQWRSEHEKLGLLMSYYHRGRPEVAAAWRDVQESVTRYNDCAGSWYLDHPLPLMKAEVADACKNERDDLRKQLEQLSASLEAARQYAWEGWESPEKLRSALEKEK